LAGLGKQAKEARQFTRQWVNPIGHLAQAGRHAEAEEAFEQLQDILSRTQNYYGEEFYQAREHGLVLSVINAHSLAHFLEVCDQQRPRQASGQTPSVAAAQTGVQVRLVANS